MTSADVSLALTRLAIGLLLLVWAEEVRVLELRMHFAQPRWAQFPGYELWLRSRHYVRIVRLVAGVVVLVQAIPLVRAWLVTLP